MNYLDLAINKYGEKLVLEQLENERLFKAQGSNKIAESYKKASDNDEIGYTKLSDQFIAHKIQEVSNAIYEFVHGELNRKGRRGQKPLYLDLVNEIGKVYKEEKDLKEFAEMAGYLTLTTMLGTLTAEKDSEKTYNTLSKRVMELIEREVKARQVIGGLEKAHREAFLKGVNERYAIANKEEYVKHFLGHYDDQWVKWDVKASMYLGTILMDIVIKNTDYFVEDTHMNSKGKQSTLSIQPSEWLAEAWEINLSKLIGKGYSKIPCVIPPRPWTSILEGGYYGDLIQHSAFIRHRSIRQKLEHMDIFTRNYFRRLLSVDLSRIFEAVNAIQNTPWQINKDILDVAIHCMEIGGGIAGLPSKPRKVSAKAEKDAPIEIIRKVAQKRKKEILYNKGVKTEKFRVIRDLAVAKEFSKYNEIYFVYNLDSRGRIYPEGSFHPQGCDLNKALLNFANVPAIEDEEAIYWLKIHIANVYGKDKETLPNRLKWTEENEALILEIAENPKGTIALWEGTDSPFMFLSACMEYKKYKEYLDKNGTAIGLKLHIPINWDGSCSGIQHLSAMLRDEVGGKEVNLTDNEKVADIYGKVAKIVQERIDNDKINGTEDTQTESDGKVKLELGTKTLAYQWDTYGITRNVTKRNVMTLCYGSTLYGFGEQQLEDIVKPCEMDVDKEHIFTNGTKASHYMAKLVWESVTKVVVKGVEAMQFLQEISKLVCSSGRPVAWTTPMGLPVQQSYFNEEIITVRAVIAGNEKRLYTSINNGTINSRKQANAVSPNFVHSLDASHMQLTTLMAKAEGIEHFSMIHDSFGTTVANAGKIRRIVREAFVKMYETSNPLETFVNEVSLLIEDKDLDKIPTMPTKGNLDIKEVLKSDFAFH